MSQGDTDKRDAKDTIDPPPDADANVSGEPSDRAADASRLSTSESTTSATNNAGVNGDTGAALSIDQREALSVDQREERSPGPHPEEMVNGVEEEGGFIRLNGMLPEMGVVKEEENGTSLGSSQDSGDGDQDISSEGFDPDLRRVKVYELIGSRWTDRGTAFCSGDFDEHAEEAKLIARSETTSEVLLSCTIRATDVYQRQQDTLIVWTEPDGTDFALSFQDVEGCAEVWEFIVEVQRHLNTNRAPNTAAQIIQSGHLPEPKPDAPYIGEIEKAIRTMARSAKSRETMCSYIQENNFIHQLIATFEAAEKEENLDALHALCSCMQTILLLNEHQMYEHILVDELWMGVVGILEYDPEFPKYKANYRDFLLQRCQFLQPIVIDDQGIQRKIHHTYRLQYLKDVILGRALDDSTFNVLNSCIIFNQIDIINHVQQDNRFLTELVMLFIRPPSTEKGKGKDKDKDSDLSMEVDNSADKAHGINGIDSSSSAGPSSSQQHHSDASDEIDRKKEVILLLQQLCAMGKNVQLPTRVNLFRSLVERGVLYAVQWALCRPEKHLVSTAGEILATLLDHLTLSVRNHILSQAVALGQPNGEGQGITGQEPLVKPPEVVPSGLPPPFKETLSQVLSRMLANSHDFALQNQLADALRMLSEVPPADAAPDLHPAGGIGPKLLARPGKDDHSTERFLDNFYKVCVEALFRPLTHDVPEHHELKNKPFLPSRERGNLYLYLCDLLCNFAIQHSFRSYFFVLSSNVVSRVATLLSVRDKHLCLAALRFFRICLKMNNRNLFAHIHKHECFTPIANLSVREARRDSLLSSTCQEFFEYMRKENLKDPINYVMEKHEVELRQLAKSALGSTTFQGFVSRWEINKEPPPSDDEKKPTAVRTIASRVMESEEEESYFQGDEDDDDPVVPVQRVDNFIAQPQRRRRRLSTPGADTQPHRGMRPVNVPSQRPTSPLSSLLDYDEDDDITSPRQEQPNPLLAGRHSQDSLTPNSPILPHRQIQILPYEPPEHEPSDPEDDLLEALVSNGPKKLDTSSSASSPASSSRSGTPTRSAMDMAPIRPREKRRRGHEDEDEDMLERLAPKNRRLSNTTLEHASMKVKGIAPKQTEDAPKKLKLKFSAAKPLTETVSVTSRADVKDGEKG